MGQTVGAAGLAETTVSWETDAEHILLKVFRQDLTHEVTLIQMWLSV